MPDPLSCASCGSLLAVESASGLCPACAPAAEPATVTHAPPAPAGEPGTVTAPGAPPVADTPNAAADPTPQSAASAPPDLHAPTHTAPGGVETASAPTAPAKPDAPLPPNPSGYTLLRRLGKGGMGEVFLARNHHTGQTVALKRMAPEKINDSSFERFEKEFRVLANCQHAYVVRVLHYDFKEHPPYFTMEYVEGGTAADQLKKGQRYEPKEAVELIRKVALAVQALHEHRDPEFSNEGVLHRDIKPSNILLTKANEPKLADLGLAKYCDLETLTPTDAALGTPAFMPPEQCGAQFGETGYTADVYGLGATLYYMLTAKPPFQGTAMEIILKLPTEEPPPVCAVAPDVPDMLGRIVRSCMHKRPGDRYQTVGALIAALDAWLADLTPKLSEPSVPTRVWRWTKRNAVALCACALLALGGAVIAARPRPAESAVPLSAEEGRAKQLKAIHADLRAGKPVTLVGDKGEPVVHTAPIAPISFAANPRRTATDPGGCYFHSNGVSILTLLEPPIDSYRLELYLQHTDGKFTTDPALGVFTGYQRVGGRDGWTEHQFLSVGFADIGRPNAKRVPTSRVRLASHVCAHAPGGLPVPIAAPSLKEPEFATAEVFAGRWRKVVIDVTPARFVCYWDSDPNAPGAVPTFDFTLDALRKHQRLHDTVLGDTGAALDHTFAPLIPWSPRGGVGVWTMGADVAIKNVLITPK